uniref:Uncharacterized protein n=1 Tax=Acrobeloides nanus TaxID=290746 RepID=A0A914CLY9_9BILA
MWIEMGVTYVAHAILLLLYFWSFIISRSQSMKTVAHKKERRLLIQALFSGTPCFILMTFHHLIRFPLLELLGGDWCILNGPIVYLWFNTEMRNDFIEIIGWCCGISKRSQPKQESSRITLAKKSSYTELEEIFL